MPTSEHQGNNDAIRIILLVLFLVTNSAISFAQDADDQQDIKEIFRHKIIDTLKVKAKKTSVLVVPVITSSPATGVSFGAAAQISWYTKNEDDVRLSSISSNFLYTTKGQTLLFVKSNLYTMKNKLFLSGDARLYFFSEDTYGLGTNAPEGAVANNIFGLNGYTISNDSLTQPLTFDYVKFHQTASYEVAENLFMGIGYHLDQYNKIRDLRLNESTNYLTSHYLYSNKYGFRQDQYTASGVSANIVYDSRDNAVNAYKGWFANGNLRYNPTQLGSSKESVLALMEVRHFQSLSRTQPRKVLAFWGIANWVVSGDVPYLVLPALGYDQRARSGRGYAAGRFRGQSMLYGEAEYRFPISPNTKILGGVLFANVTTTSNKDTQVKLFDYLRGSYGGGLRVMIDKRTRTNLGLDIAFGKQATGLYIVATEAF